MPVNTCGPALVAGLVLVAVGAPALGAKPAEQQRAAVLQAIVDCRALKDADRRLACFDAAAARLDEAEASGQVVVVDKQQAQAVRREVFGLQLPSLDLFNRPGRPGDQSEAVDRVTETVRAAGRAQDGRWTVELEGGAVWRQIDSNSISRPPHPGSKVEIRKASLGSFMMKVDGQPAIRVHRDR